MRKYDTLKNSGKDNKAIQIQLTIKEFFLILGMLGHAFTTYLAHQRQEMLFNEILSVKNALLKELPAISQQIKVAVDDLDVKGKAKDLKEDIINLVKEVNSSKIKISERPEDNISDIVSVVSPPPTIITSSDGSLLDTLNYVFFHPFVVKGIGICLFAFICYSGSNKISLAISEFFKSDQQKRAENFFKENPLRQRTDNWNPPTTVNDIVTQSVSTKAVGGGGIVPKNVIENGGVDTIVTNSESVVSNVAKGSSNNFFGFPDASKVIIDELKEIAEIADEVFR